MKRLCGAVLCGAIVTAGLAIHEYYCNDEPKSISSLSEPAEKAGEPRSDDTGALVDRAAGGAVTVTVRANWELSTKGPFPLPDCRVDVFHTICSDSEERRSFILLENVRVLSCSVETSGRETVLSLSPDDAQKVTNAQQTGKLTLVHHKTKSPDLEAIADRLLRVP